MICPCCKQPKERNDFYWRKGNPTELIYKDCRTCVTKRNVMAQKEKRLAKKDFLYQYFN